MERLRVGIVGLCIAVAIALAAGLTGSPQASSAITEGSTPTIAATGVHLTFSLGIETDPTTILGTTGKVDGLWVQWGFEDVCATGSGTVEWREPGGALNVVAGKIVGEVVYGGARTIHGAKLPLVPGASTIEYQVKCGLDVAHPWTSTRLPPGNNGTIRIAAWADSGTPGYHDGGPIGGPESPPLLTQGHLLSFDPHLLLMPGDLAYADAPARDAGGKKIYTAAEIWDAFHELFEPIFSTVPSMPVAGNHEYENTATRFHQFTERWVLPDDEMHYGFRAGPVSIIGMNSYESCMSGTGPDARCEHKPAWGPNELAGDRLLAELIRAYNSGAAWTIVYFHHPPYAAGGGHDAHGLILEEWVPRFQQYGVDLVLTGHDHNYQRSHPLVNGEVRQNATNEYTEEGVVYMVLGGGGRDLYSIDLSHAAPWRKVANDTDHQHVEITASPTALAVSVISAETGATIDAFSISK